MKFAITLPTWNRASVIQRAIRSVQTQTHQDWKLLVLDDGSTDATRDVVQRYLDDDRIEYIPFNRNQGTTAMMEAGIRRAIDCADVWSYLASDDWFYPDKLAHDAVALVHAPAAYGPFAIFREDQKVGEYLAPHPDPKSMLLDMNTFALSWANIAVRVEVLKKVLDRFGDVCPAEVRLVCDVVLNARMVKFAPFTFREGVDAVWCEGGSSVSAAPFVCEDAGRAWGVVRRERHAS